MSYIIISILPFINPYSLFANSLHCSSVVFGFFRACSINLRFAFSSAFSGTEKVNKIHETKNYNTNKEFHSQISKLNSLGSSCRL